MGSILTSENLIEKKKEPELQADRNQIGNTFVLREI